MDHREVGGYWNANAGAWAQLSRAGYDTYRDHLNTPAFLDLLPGVAGQRGLDIGCGEGYNARQLAQRGAWLTAIEIGDYFQNLEGDVSEWIFSAAPEKETAGLPLFKTPRFTRTLSQWLNLLIDAGFSLEQLGEPRPSDALVRQHPNLQDAQIVAYFLIVRARKPG